ncbi:flagellar export chaperone FliS [Nocardioides mangrovicus]|nr:flagellar export chaperone FliS [Nocardioides mangrovicus]
MSDVRAAYVDNSVATADPARLLVLLCQRLVLDLRRAVAALEGDDLAEAHRNLVHAQDIVTELRTSLDPTGFAGGHELAALYDYVYRRLLQANLHKDVIAAAECEVLVRSIAETWQQAAMAVAGGR